MQLARFQDIFSNREIALYSWILLGVAWALWKPKIRSSLAGVVRAFCQKKILAIVFGLVLWTAVAVLGLRALGLWTLTQLKDTVLWFVGAGVVTLITSGTKDNSWIAFRSSAAEILTVAVVVEFLANLYSFPLWVELCVVPVVVLAVAMQAFTEGKEEYRILRAPLGCVSVCYGVAVLATSIYSAATNFKDVATLDTARSFLLAPALSMAALPYFYLFLLLVAYEQAFLRLRWTIKDPTLRTFAKRRLVCRLHGRLGAIESWKHHLGGRTIGSKAEFLRMLQSVLAKQAASDAQSHSE